MPRQWTLRLEYGAIAHAMRQFPVSKGEGEGEGLPFKGIVFLRQTGTPVGRYRYNTKSAAGPHHVKEVTRERGHI
jgi:hypothetical protein